MSQYLSQPVEASQPTSSAGRRTVTGFLGKFLGEAFSGAVGGDFMALLLAVKINGMSWGDLSRGEIFADIWSFVRIGMLCGAVLGGVVCPFLPDTKKPVTSAAGADQTA